MILLQLACAAAGNGSDDVALTDFARLDGSWTWRDDGGDDTPDGSTLLHGEAGDEGISLRRGVRYTDGVDVGSIALEVGDALEVDGWRVDDHGAADTVVLVDAGETWGDTSSSGCRLDRPDEVDTYYASWDDAAVVDCGDTQWSFGKGAGLVALTADDWTMELVAPW